ncbi:angio-associated migratory cell protein isoform X2 [Brassica rapa]|uniref:angio-associated migratory cell protein isoform X2 n=1 Tax=Brassica campestris TaxID=3711 RepID=UPI00142E4D42|nr:angio-associated migratory cell protein isoform X2 [Brassica rapa]
MSNRDMNNPAMEEEDEGDVFLGESDVLHEIDVDGEDLPDAFDEDDNDNDNEDEVFDENDDSVHTFTGHKGELYALACSPLDPTLVATGGGDDKAFLWKIGNGDWAAELPAHKDSVSSLAFSYDGQLLASGGLDGVVQIFDASSGALKCVLDGPGSGIEWVKWHPRGHIVLAGSEDCSMWMWNADKEAYLNMFSGHNQSVTCGDFTPDGKLICTGSDDASLIVWNPKTCESIHVVKGHPYHTEGLICLDINSNSSLAISGSKDGSVHIVNIVTGKVVSSLSSHTESVECVKFSPSSATIPMAATGGMDKKLVIWDLQHSTPRFICEHAEGVTCVSWIGTSKYLATGCGDGTVSVWDSLLGNCVHTYHGHQDAVQSISVSANTEFIVSVSVDHTARVYDTSEFQNKME